MWPVSLQRPFVCLYSDLFSVYLMVFTTFSIIPIVQYYINRIGDVMINVLASNIVYRGFEHRSGQTKEYKNGICCFPTKQVVSRTITGWLGIGLICSK
jgi:hypothetical protein